MSRLKTAVVIPSRYGSSRFPGKPLAMLCGKPMVQHVYEKAVSSHADAVLVATDDQRIFDAVEAFGGRAVMTSPDHPSGTDRIAEAIAVCGEEFDAVINVQGDEPLIPTSVIDELIDLFNDDPAVEMSTVAVPGDRASMTENNVKVVMGADGYALYFSRSMIPFLRSGGVAVTPYLHWGIYSYRREVLERFVALPPGQLENCEKLEQLRALENGIRIKVITSNLTTIGIDTPADLEAAEKRLKGM
ncbi:MAG: 3-deoxy-manno-octulosonate cytidylyltransferase [Victivallaceae bacterium]|nr:3-deoxy-manno-octulosonate cytidylyltransferase [Victivallaceae bacterium]